MTGTEGKTGQFSYGTARHEVAAWYAAAGPEGFRDLIASLRDGGNFRKLHGRAAEARRLTGRSTWNISTGADAAEAKGGRPTLRGIPEPGAGSGAKAGASATRCRPAGEG